jgi:hypothetical protein
MLLRGIGLLAADQFSVSQEQLQMLTRSQYREAV